MPVRRVWVEDWQMQCCGEPFTVGSEINWTTHAPERGDLVSILGEEAAGQITDIENHHGPEMAPPIPLSGVVTRISAVYV